METKKTIQLTIPYTLLIATIQTIIAVIPGILLAEERIKLTSGIGSLFIYLFLAEFYQLFSRTAYKNGRTVSIQAYFVKLVVSLLLMVNIATKLTLQYGIILVAYEVFQFLSFSAKYHYQDTLLHTILSAFFKGLVFNLMLTIEYPFTFKIAYVEPYLFSMAMIFFSTIVIQNLYSALGRKGMYGIIGSVSYIVIIGYLIYQLKTHHLSLLITILLVAIISIGAIVVMMNKRPKKREFIMNFELLLVLIVYYLAVV